MDSGTSGPTGRERDNRGRFLGWVMLAVTLWGGLLAVGAFLYGYDPATGEVAYAPHLLRGGIVLAFVLAFLGGWLWLARRRFR